MEFRILLKTIMREQGLNQRESAELCGISPVQFGMYCQGKVVPKFDNALKIIEALNWKLIPTIK
jgi:transcriptional regulator with XRE-family HTH domain